MAASLVTLVLAGLVATSSVTPMKSLRVTQGLETPMEIALFEDLVLCTSGIKTCAHEYNKLSRSYNDCRGRLADRPVRIVETGVPWELAVVGTVAGLVLGAVVTGLILAD